MWNSFASIFENKKLVTNDHTSSYLLNKTSKRCPTPSKSKITLWPHQEAMLARCKHIESYPKFAEPVVLYTERYKEDKEIPIFKPAAIGIMNDPPGSGKTFAILSLIADDAKPGINIIIVPQNIYIQWETAIKTIYGPASKPTVPYLCCNNYAVINQLYLDPTLLNDFRVILFNDIYANNIAQTITDNKIPIRRLVVDEIDSIQKRMLNPIQAEHVWLLSASFVHKEYLAIGPYKIKSDYMSDIICKCDPVFVSEHFGMCEPASEIIWCEDSHIALWKDIVPDTVITALNAGDIRPLLKTMYKVYPQEKRALVNLAEERVKELEERAKELEETANSLKLADLSGTEVISDPARIISEKARLRTQAAREKDLAKILSDRLSGFDMPDISGVKFARFIEDIIQRIKTNPASKWIIFNDNQNALFDTQNILKAYDISCGLIDGGNADAISNAIKAYKEGWTHEIKDASGNKQTITEHYQVLLLNATTEGAGMNLENTSHMLFMHATNSRLVEQVIGRAQRFGRVGQLLIIGMFNNNEKNLVYKSKE
jgi:hypothetical protein